MLRYVVPLLLFLALACATDLVIEKTFVPATCSQKSKVGDTLYMHYSGYIAQSSATGSPGSKFDSSLDRGRPFDFPLGTGRVIKGWDEGLQDMCPGEKRTLIIPPDMGYGARGAGNVIPGGATLKFDVELLSIGTKPDL